MVDGPKCNMRGDSFSPLLLGLLPDTGVPRFVDPRLFHTCVYKSWVILFETESHMGHPGTSLSPPLLYKTRTGMTRCLEVFDQS